MSRGLLCFLHSSLTGLTGESILLLVAFIKLDSPIKSANDEVLNVGE